MASWHWAYSVMLPENGLGRARVWTAIHEYFVALAYHSPGMTFSLQESPHAAFLLDIRLHWEGPQGGLDPAMFVATMERDILTIVNNHNEPEVPKKKKSIWEWLVDKNPYD